MPYRTVKRGRRSFTRKAAARRRPARASYGRRTYKKSTRYGRSRGMTRKSVLNLTSIKKRDTMLIATNTSIATPSGGTTYNANPAVMNGALTYVFPWICTWRDNSITSTSGQVGSKFDPATRSATTCYMRGLREKNIFVTNDGSAWLWRRICFTWKGSELYQQTTNGYSFAFESSAGFQRIVNDVNNGSTAIRGALLGLIFRGRQNLDWNNYFTAPIDTTNITLKMDRTIQLNSGNQQGRTRVLTDWLAMNKNLVYADDEAAGDEDAANASTRGKAGMGDYYVIDMFTCGAPQGAGTTMTWSPEATLYWHEK